MYKELLIRIDADTTAAALIEDKQLVNINFEHNNTQRLMGNIYKGKVDNVLPGMQAAFIDVGMEKNNFLYIDDALPKVFNEHGESIAPERMPINEVLKRGQELIIQVFKEPVGSKGARVTTHPTLPGRYLVLMPTSQNIAVSRRIEGDKERERLKSLMASLLPQGMGVIIRTVAMGVEKDVLAADLKSLLKLWKYILGKSVKAAAPALIHRDLGLLQRLVRDTGAEDIDNIIVESADAKERVLQVIEDIAPQLREKVFIYDGDLFLKHDVDRQLEKSLLRKVWLDSGGYIIIDQMEALTAIDVNTGKYVGEVNLSETVLHINLEAVAEIVRQIRLRNIGGIIIVDFIDMYYPEHKEQLLRALEEELKKDRTKVIVLGMTQLGLVEMTRKKIGQELTTVLEKDCPFCHGKGRVMREDVVAVDVKKELQSLALETDAKAVMAEANPYVAAFLIGPLGRNIEMLESKLNKRVIIRGNSSMGMSEYIVRACYEDSEEDLSPVKVGQRMTVRILEQHIENETDGIAKVDGFIISIADGGDRAGEDVRIEIEKTHRTYARAIII